MANPENKQIPYESTQKDIRDAIESVATAIGGITHPDAEDIVYDNSVSGLSATDVQNAIDELSSEKADSSSLATVATSGDYDDLINKPTIPTVNDATLTIQKNGSDVATFTANASSNVTANVTVPTTTSELTNNSDFVSDASYVHTDNNFTNAEKTKLSGIESGAEVNVQSDWNEADNTADDYIKNKPSSEVKTATDTFTTVNGGLLSKCLIDLVPVQSGSGDPSPDNVRPISGHTEVDLYNVGFNLWDEEWEVGKYNDDGTKGQNSNTIRSKNRIPILPNTNYYMTVAGESSTSVRRVFWDANGNLISSVSMLPVNVVFTTPNNARYMAIGMGTVYGNVYNHDICINISDPSKNGTYEPYLGHLYQVQIGSTVYGGTLDVVSGVIKNKTKKIVVSSSTPCDNFISSSNGSSARIAINGVANSNNLCDKCSFISYDDRISPTYLNQNRVYIDPNGWLIIRASATETVSTISELLTLFDGYEIVYYCSNEQVVNHAPQQIEALVGENNLSTPLDGQSIDSVEYREVFAFDDVEKVVSLRVPISMLGTDESGRTTASRAYTMGEFFYKDGKMYKVLTSIASGATFTVGTNISETTLFAELTALA